MKDLGRPRIFLGYELRYSPTCIAMTQVEYCEKLLALFGMKGCKPCDTPCVDVERLPSYMKDEVFAKFYRSASMAQMIGGVLWLARGVRPDIASSVSIAASYIAQPEKGKRIIFKIFRYLAGTKSYGLKFKIGNSDIHHNLLTGSFGLQCYSDSDLASDKRDRKSRGGWVVFLNGAPIAWHSSKQSVVSTSTAEAELRALASCLKEILSLRNLFKELKFQVDAPTQLWVDNEASRKLASTHIFSGRLKHVEIALAFCNDYIAKGHAVVRRVATQDNVADLFTKMTSPTVFQRLVASLVKPIEF